jgi:malonate transporter and related proteins
MLSLLLLTLPIYLLVGLGYVIVRSGYVSAADLKPIGQLVLRVSMPALIFLAISRLPISEALRWDFIGGYLAGSLAVFGFGFGVARLIYRRPMAPSAMIALGMSCSNSAFMAFPVAVIVVGEAAALQVLPLAMLVENLIIIPLALTLAETQGGQNPLQALRKTLASMCRNPLLLAVAGALVFTALGLHLPDFLSKTLAMLAPIAAPVALLSIGGTVATLSARLLNGPIVLVVLSKLILHPLAVWAALSLIPGLDPVLHTSGIIFAAAPMLSIFALLGLRYKLEEATATALIFATAASFFTISGLIAVLAP